MNRLLSLRGMAACLLAVVGLAALPGISEAGWLGFRNETNTPVVVQVSTVGPRVQHGKPHLLHRGNVTWERILQPGSKLVTIYDAAQPKRVLFQGPLVIGGADMFFAIQMDATPLGPPGAAPVIPKLKLVPAKPQTPPGPGP